MGAFFLMCGILGLIRGQTWILGALSVFGLTLLLKAIFAPCEKLEKWFAGLQRKGVGTGHQKI